MSMKIPMTPPGIKPVTIRLVAQCLNQFSHSVFPSGCQVLRLVQHLDEQKECTIGEAIRKYAGVLNRGRFGRSRFMRHLSVASVHVGVE